MSTDSQLDNLLKTNIANSSESEHRIQNIVSLAKQEVGLRDLLTHVLLNIWMPIISIGSIFFVLFNRNKKTKL